MGSKGMLVAREPDFMIHGVSNTSCLARSFG